MNTQTLSTDLLRRLALLQHLGEDFFIINVSVLDQDYKAFEGNQDELRTQYDDEMNELNDSTENSTFEEWCINNCTEIEELDVDDCYDVDYYVLTDSEADEKWDESLDSYLEECVYPDLPESMRFYFDDEKWKRDARIDGRGHSLSSYDGNENEETVEGETFYIYRIN